MSCARWDATAVVADCLYVLGGGWGGVGLGAIAEGALGWGRLVGWLVGTVDGSEIRRKLTS